MSREQHQNKVQAAAQELLAFSQDYAIIRQLQSPIGALGEQISAQNKQLNTLNRAKAKGNLSLAEFLPAKQAIEVQTNKLKAELARYEQQLKLLNAKASARPSPLIDCDVVEQLFHLELPSLYKQLARDEMLSYAEAFGPDWYTKSFPSLKSHPPFLLFAQSFEALSLHDMFQHLRDMAQRPLAYPYSEWHEDFSMVPFAGDGSGDLYAFYYARPGQEPWVIHWWHDSDHCDILAHNLADFMFLKMLDCALETHPQDSLLADGDVQANAIAWLASHEKYFSAARRDLLRQAFKGPWLLDAQEQSLSSISEQTYQAIIQQAFPGGVSFGEFSYINPRS
jgi:SMI1-KNR4 cell-wall